MGKIGLAQMQKGFNSNQSVAGGKKNILKNSKVARANDEDYKVMQNIRHQMGGKLVSPLVNHLNFNSQDGLHSTKNQQIEKSLENLLNEFKSVTKKQKQPSHS